MWGFSNPGPRGERGDWTAKEAEHGNRKCNLIYFFVCLSFHGRTNITNPRLRMQTPPGGGNEKILLLIRIFHYLFWCHVKFQLTWQRVHVNILRILSAYTSPPLRPSRLRVCVCVWLDMPVRSGAHMPSRRGCWTTYKWVALMVWVHLAAC